MKLWWKSSPLWVRIFAELKIEQNNRPDKTCPVCLFLLLLLFFSFRGFNGNHLAAYDTMVFCTNLQLRDAKEKYGQNVQKSEKKL